MNYNFQVILSRQVKALKYLLTGIVMIDKRQWYAVYTRPRWEKKVASLLTRNSIENYCPLNKVRRQWSDRKKIVEEPLFTSYVFVRVSEKEHCFLKQTTGIVNMVYWLGSPAVIRDSEIEMIKRFLNDYPCVSLEKTKISINDRVQIIGGPLMQMEGQVVALKNRTVKVALPSLGYTMQAEVEAENIRIIIPDISKQKDLINTKYAIK